MSTTTGVLLIASLMNVSACVLSDEALDTAGQDDIATGDHELDAPDSTEGGPSAARPGWAACKNTANGELCFRGVDHEGLSSTDMLYDKESGGTITARFYLRDQLTGQLIWDDGWFEISEGQARTYIFTGASIFALTDECMAVQGQSDVCVLP
jgi:hypothetical protein